MPALTTEDLECLVDTVEYVTVGRKTTLCVIVLISGFEVIGSSACVDPADYDVEVGKPIARQKAINKIWELEGYRQQWTKGYHAPPTSKEEGDTSGS